MSAYCTGIDRYGIDLSCTGAGQSAAVRALFSEPLEKAADVRPATVALVQRARAAAQATDAPAARLLGLRPSRPHHPPVPAAAEAHRVEPMLLAVDVGNTQTHFGTFRDCTLVEHWRFATVPESTADELGAAMRNLLELRGIGLADISASIVSSTVPALEPRWLAMGERYLGHTMLAVGPGLKTGMALRYDNPREIGADRLANAVAIRERFGGPAVCVDFGTSVNFDVIGADGDFLGGVLVPGVEISLAALTSRGAKLPTIDLLPPKAVIGKSTVDAIRSGVVYGFAGAIDGILRRLLDELGEDTDVIATGGLAGAIVPYTELIDEVDDLLTLTGLRLLHERNA